MVRNGSDCRVPKKSPPTQVKLTQENAAGVDAIAKTYRKFGLEVSSNQVANAVVAAGLKCIEKGGGAKPFCSSLN